MLKKLFSSMPTIAPITITDRAWDKMNEILQQEKKSSFIFSATSGGCNGFNYNLKLLHDDNYQHMNSQIRKAPISYIKRNNVNVIIDPTSELFLVGTTIDYIYENYDNSIFESKFIFIPDKNLASSCGCGISFTPK